MLTGSREYDIILLGCGFAGTAVLAQLARAGASGVRVAVVDPAPSWPAGDAFSRARPEHILNVPAGRMSAFADQPDQFAGFAADRLGHPVEPLRPMFLPRRLYQDYLTQLLDDSTAHLRTMGCTVDAFHRTAVSVAPAEGAYQITLDGGESISAADVVMATGPRALGFAKPGSTRVFNGPWDLTPERIASLPSQGLPALVVGTGLTGIDSVVTLQRHGWRDGIVAVSTVGAFPLAHAPAGPAPDTEPRLANLRHARSLSAFVQALRREVRLCAMLGVPWQKTLDALRPHTSSLWLGLSPSDRRRVSGRVFNIWNLHRHRVPPQVSTGLERMKAQGQLRVTRRRVVVAYDAGAAAIAGFAARQGPPEFASFALAIDARGFDFTFAQDPLVIALVKHRLARRSATGLGLVTDAQMAAHRHAGGAFYALGAINLGERLETVSVPELRVQAQTAVNAIMTAAATAAQA